MKTFCFDFDGVIHTYSKGWHDGTVYDYPVTGAFEAIKSLIDAGHSVFILSTRRPAQIIEWLNRIHYDEAQFTHSGIKVPFKYRRVRFWEKFWNKKGVVGVTNRKLPAVAYIDDRAVPFYGDFDALLPGLLEFKTYQEKQ